MAQLKLDLHPIYNNSKAIDQALIDLFEDAQFKKIKTLEIIPGKGSGQLKKKVLRFMENSDIKPLIKRIDKDSKNFGRIFIYLK
ncbi:MAG: Smr/MutS family protein [Flavobacteriales bacterium]|nr:Smr/MutS family protein [Flavobacteriales bacterium]